MTLGMVGPSFRRARLCYGKSEWHWGASRMHGVLAPTPRISKYVSLGPRWTVDMQHHVSGLLGQFFLRKLGIRANRLVGAS